MLDLTFKLKPSKQYLALLAIILLMSTGIICSLSMDGRIQVVSGVLLAVYAGPIVWRYGLLKSQRSIVSIRRHGDGSWRLYTRNHHHHAALRGDSTVTRWAMILYFDVPRHCWKFTVKIPQSCVIFPDSLSRDDYRHLFVAVRIQEKF